LVGLGFRDGRLLFLPLLLRLFALTPFFTIFLGTIRFAPVYVLVFTFHRKINLPVRNKETVELNFPIDQPPPPVQIHRFSHGTPSNSIKLVTSKQATMQAA
jgi:hypothetical protein